MSTGHTRIGGSASIEVGNVLGDRPCVRQSRLYREQCGGNAMKELLGQDSLKWDINQTEGAYKGRRVYDHHTQAYSGGTEQPEPTAPAPTGLTPTEPVQAPEPAPAKNTPAPSVQHARRGMSNRSTYNILTGEDN